MKRPIATLAATLSLCAAAAGWTAPREVSLRLDEPQTVTFDGDAHLALLWNRVDDSRCPTDAVCIWEGEVAVSLVVDGAHEVRLTRQFAGDERAAARVAGFTLRLRAVDPWPLAEPPARSDYVAHIDIAPPGEELPARTAVRRATWGELKAEEHRPSP
jgi:hypothetical protein